MSNTTIIILVVVGLAIAVGLWVHGLRVGSRIGFRSGKESERPVIASLQSEVGTLTDEKNRLKSESREVARKREENQRRSEDLDEREARISKSKEQQHEADRNLKSRARQLREERGEMEEREATRFAELESEQRLAKRTQERAKIVEKYYSQAARSAVPVYIGKTALERECAGVYVVSREDTMNSRAVKIGMTDDFSRRFKELDSQCKSVGIVDLRPEVLVPMDEGRRRVEASIHDRFKSGQKAREWFAISPDEAVQAVIYEAWRVKTGNAQYRELRHAEFMGGEHVDALPAILRKFSGITLLHLAAAQNDAPEIKRLLRLPMFVNNIRVEDNRGYTPMDWAVGCNAAEAIAEFHSRDSEYVKLPFGGSGGLMRLAAIKGADKSILALAKLGLKADAKKDSNGIAPIHLAANAKSVSALIGLGADVNMTDKDGNMPLHFARSPCVVEALVKNGANINGRNKKGETPICAVADRHSVNVAMENWDGPKTRQIVVSLMENGADVAELAEGGVTLMHYAARWDDVDLIAKLAAHDENLVGAEAADDWTPLHSAAGWNSIDAINKLAHLGAFIDPQTRSDNETPLHLTVENEYVEAAEALLDNGADVNACSKSGTPMNYCAEVYGYTNADDSNEDEAGYRIIKLLAEHGGGCR